MRLKPVDPDKYAGLPKAELQGQFVERDGRASQLTAIGVPLLVVGAKRVRAEHPRVAFAPNRRSRLRLAAACLVISPAPSLRRDVRLQRLSTHRRPDEDGGGLAILPAPQNSQ